MPPVYWSDTYRIGHASIDQHHQELVQDLELLQAAIATADNRTQILGLFDEWLDQFARHAQAEESLMAHLRQPAGIAHRHAHCAEHADFLHQAMDLRNDIARGRDQIRAMETLSMQLIAFDLIRRDFEMIGLLLREGLVLED
ncbi:bacteriohemerythrin [Magnetospirillum sulfuroxidans]|uniref:Hemerythrin domain-containing protein n=1 Tax=Magnetospirillum sulfuroxidans TaxID=611300 RepID=A0ABS5I718_9PROT|nr:hemerythrin domain-containing protein [Magnetospirillum sulfuroxidans]